MKNYPAIEVRAGEPDMLLAIVDDFAPIALEELESSGAVRLFFSTARDRDAARLVLIGRFDTTAIEVSDEDWARRSQETLSPVTVGRITVFPDPASRDTQATESEPDAIRLVIVPSMGFGTGHHATTRLCLAALQTIGLRNQVVLDVGTGSGVLALAAARLGASQVVGIDYDPDAIQSANDNLLLNRSVTHVSFQVLDLASGVLPPADVVTANLTGALLARAAPLLLAAVRPGGTLILSGILRHERDEVRAAFAAADVVWDRDEEEWVGLIMKKR